MERDAKLQWRIMACAYGISHAPALLLLLLLLLKFPGHEGKNVFLVFFLVFAVQSCMLAQHLASRRWPRTPKGPRVSKNFNCRGWTLAVGLACLLGGVLAEPTPFQSAQAAAVAMALIACVAACLAYLLVMALKRDGSITNWRSEDRSVTGASSLLERVEAMCFAAPVFAHSLCWVHGRWPK